MRPLLVSAAVLVAGCTSTDPEPIGTGAASVTAPPGGAYALFSFETGDVVAAADSATTRWDVGFRGADDVVLNGGASGPGAAVGVVADVDYAAVVDALADRLVYRRDGEAPCPGGPPRAVCPGDGLVETVGGAVVPALGRTLLLRLGDGQGYAKLRVTDVDEAASAVAFEYTVNPEGSAFVEDE